MRTPPGGSRYVAIGSSFAAGPGITPPATDRPTRAQQSRRNYPHLLALQCGLDLVDVTSTGATVEDILRRSQFGQPPQIVAATAQTDLVTVTCGGNDLGYIPSLVAASLPGWVAKMPVLGHRLRRATQPAQVDDRVAPTADSVAEVLAAVRRQAPHARIVCVDYLTVLPPLYRDDLPFDERTYRALVGLADDLGLALARACSAHHVDLVRASEHSRQHHAWSDGPWTTGWLRPRPGARPAFHPTAEGMAAVADLIADRATATS